MAFGKRWFRGFLCGVFAAGVSWASGAVAQDRGQESESQRTTPLFTWDFGGAAGSYNEVGYTEINLGLNWFLQDYLIWRNAGFVRFPSQGENISGLDSSLRFRYALATSGGGMGVGVFGGPGYRFSKSEASAVFAEAGLQIKLGGFFLGGGARLFSYANPGRDRFGRENPQRETLYFLILSGSGEI